MGDMKKGREGERKEKKEADEYHKEEKEKKNMHSLSRYWLILLGVIDRPRAPYIQRMCSTTVKYSCKHVWFSVQENNSPKKGIWKWVTFLVVMMSRGIRNENILYMYEKQFSKKRIELCHACVVSSSFKLYEAECFHLALFILFLYLLFPN